MTRSLLGLFLRAFVVLTGTALATFTLLWNAPGDPALAIAMARFDAVVASRCDRSGPRRGRAGRRVLGGFPRMGCPPDLREFRQLVCHRPSGLA